MEQSVHVEAHTAGLFVCEPTAICVTTSITSHTPPPEPLHIRGTPVRTKLEHVEHLTLIQPL